MSVESRVEAIEDKYAPKKEQPIVFIVYGRVMNGSPGMLVACGKGLNVSMTFRDRESFIPWAKRHKMSDEQITHYITEMNW